MRADCRVQGGEPALTDVMETHDVAASIHSVPEGWEKVRREYRVARFAPRITFRRQGIVAMNADFVRMAGIEMETRATLFLSQDERRLGLRFHSDEMDDEAFLLGRDGGGSGAKCMNRALSARTLLNRSQALRSLVERGGPARSCEPARDHVSGLWVVHIAPCFERALSAVDEIGPSLTGIYRYLCRGEVIYIGRGALRQRLSEPERRAWSYDQVQYSVVNDDAAERKWESFWLNEHREKHGRWPLYNKIGGATTMRASTG